MGAHGAIEFKEWQSEQQDKKNKYRSINSRAAYPKNGLHRPLVLCHERYDYYKTGRKHDAVRTWHCSVSQN